MFFKTTAECAEIARMLGFDADWQRNTINKSTSTPVHAVRANFAQRKGATYAFARRIASWVNLGFSKYPPAEPGALGGGPLKAAIGGATRPQYVSRLKAAPEARQRTRRVWSVREYFA